MSQGPSTFGSITTSSLSPTSPTISVMSSSTQGLFSALMRVHSPVAPKSYRLGHGDEAVARGLAWRRPGSRPRGCRARRRPARSARRPSRAPFRDAAARNGSSARAAPAARDRAPARPTASGWKNWRGGLVVILRLAEHVGEPLGAGRTRLKIAGNPGCRGGVVPGRQAAGGAAATRSRLPSRASAARCGSGYLRDNAGRFHRNRSPRWPTSPGSSIWSRRSSG